MALRSELTELLRALRREMREKFCRRVSTGDLLSNRWETARDLGFGEGTSCYDNVLVLGEVRVGKHTWIGPNVILDGSGGPLTIGDYCSISAGVQIYTHSSVQWATSLGKADKESAPTTLGSGVYLGPGTIVQMGVEIGDRTIVGALSVVNRSLPSGVKAWGTPARIQSPGGGEPAQSL